MPALILAHSDANVRSDDLADARVILMERLNAADVGEFINLLWRRILIDAFQGRKQA